jgi:hypothetical protein
MFQNQTNDGQNQIDYDKRDGKTRVNIFSHSKISTSVFSE